MAVISRFTAPKSRKETILTRRQIEGLIADGRSIIVVENKVLKADAWLKYHPGGDKAIMHMVGRDATDEVNAYVNSCVVRHIADRVLLLDCTQLKHDNVWMPTKSASLKADGTISYHQYKAGSSEPILIVKRIMG